MTYLVELTIGKDRIQLFLVNNQLKNRSFEEPIQRFVETLCFKNVSNVTSDAVSNITYQLYGNTYFSVEYPPSWVVDDKIIFNVLLYNFTDNRSEAIVTVVDNTKGISSASLSLLVPRSSIGTGKFEEPIQHFFDTLAFKI